MGHSIFRIMMCILLCCATTRALTVSIDTSAATAVVHAVQNRNLSYEQALEIAHLPGNQGMIRKMNEFNIPATNESFARALVAAAHDQEATQPNETIFIFKMVKEKAPQITNLIQAIAEHPENFATPIQQRVAMFSPAELNVKLQGYVIAGGDGGGYAFGEPNFYLNVAMVDDFDVARETTTHELYHAVQGAYPEAKKLPWEILPAQDANTRARRQACTGTANILRDLANEGTATYVGDISLLDKAHGELAERMRADLKDGMRHVADSITLLELSVVGLNSHDPVPEDQVYSLGFYGHGILYNVAYVMAKAIAVDEGPQALAAYLNRPGFALIEHYTHLPKYGKDAEHPALGPHTVTALAVLSAGCK